MHPLISKKIKFYLIRGYRIDLSFFEEIDVLIKVLGNTTNCQCCDRNLPENWKLCWVCKDLLCDRCYECQKCSDYFELYYQGMELSHYYGL